MKTILKISEEELNRLFPKIDMQLTDMRQICNCRVLPQEEESKKQKQKMFNGIIKRVGVDKKM